MDDAEVQESELMDEVGSLKFSPPPMKKSDTRDSISSIDSDVSLSFDRRSSKGDDADADSSDSGSELETTDPTQTELMNRLNSEIKLEPQYKTIINNNTNGVNETELASKLTSTTEIQNNGNKTYFEDKTEMRNENLMVKVNDTSNRETTDEQDEDALPQCSDEMAEKIAAQVEFYFSDENIVKDAFLLKHVKRNKQGYVSLKLISSFKRVKHLSRDWRIVGAALRAKSTELEVNEQGTKLRRRNPLPPFDQTAPSRTVLAARLPLNKLSIESVAELFAECGEIVLIRVLRPGNPTPPQVRQAIAKRLKFGSNEECALIIDMRRFKYMKKHKRIISVRQAIAKRLELGSNEECALIEFKDSSAARVAMRMSLGDARIYELQQPSSVEKKRKQANVKQQTQQPSLTASRKNAQTKLARVNVYNSSSCASGSEAEDTRILKSGRHPRVHPACHHIACGPPTGHTPRGPLPAEAWLTRRLSHCSISDVNNTNNEMSLRRLSSCSGSGSSSDNSSYPTRRFSSCSSGIEIDCVPSGIYDHRVYPNESRNPPQMYPTIGYYTQGRRFSYCSPSESIPGSPTTGYGFGYELTNAKNFFPQTGRRGSADCGPFLRRLSSCSRESSIFDTDSRRLSSCSSSSELECRDSCSKQFRPRSNSNFVLMAHLPENVTRMPSGPDGTRGFGRLIPNARNDNYRTTKPTSAILTP